jgi:hypothetical protein
MKRKRFRLETADERAAREGRPDAAKPQAQCEDERVQAELASHKPGAAGLTVRSKRHEC